jgi:hypothetical protein
MTLTLWIEFIVMCTGLAGCLIYLAFFDPWADDDDNNDD